MDIFPFLAICGFSYCLYVYGSIFAYDGSVLNQESPKENCSIFVLPTISIEESLRDYFGDNDSLQHDFLNILIRIISPILAPLCIILLLAVLLLRGDLFRQ